MGLVRRGRRRTIFQTIAAIPLPTSSAAASRYPTPRRRSAATTFSTARFRRRWTSPGGALDDLGATVGVAQDGLGLLGARGLGFSQRRVRQAALPQLDVQRVHRPLDLDPSNEPGQQPGQHDDGDAGDPTCREDTLAPVAGRRGSGWWWWLLWTPHTGSHLDGWASGRPCPLPNRKRHGQATDNAVRHTLGMTSATRRQRLFGWWAPNGCWLPPCEGAPGGGGDLRRMANSGR